MPNRRSAFWLVSALAASALVSPTSSHAQAWVPAPGEGSVSAGYQYTTVREHLLSVPLDGSKRWDWGRIFGRTAEFSADYGVLPGLAASASVAYLSSKYVGSGPEGPLDDGRYHGDLQDFAFGVRYLVAWQSIAITPMLITSIPAKDYSTFGHSAVGRGKKELAVGLAVGRSLEPLAPSAFVQMTYQRAIVENHHEHSLDQNRFGASAGYFLGRRFSFGGLFQYMNTVDGVDWMLSEGTEQNWHDHDTAAKVKALRAGGFLSVSLSRGLGLRLSYMSTFDGANTHDSRSFTITPTWNFATPFHR